MNASAHAPQSYLRRPRRAPARLRRTRLAQAVLLCGALALPGLTLAQGAAGAEWVDWTAATPDHSRVTGTLVTGGRSVGITFEGAAFTSFTGRLPEPYFGPSSTYQSSLITGTPPLTSDLIVVAGGPGTGTYRLSFSEAVTDPILAIVSLGLTNESRTVNIQTGMWFNQPVEVLSNGANYFAGGQWTPFIVGPGGTDLFGTESSGVVRFKGTFNEITWVSPLREEREPGASSFGTYMFTFGTAGCLNYEQRRLTADARVRAGCSAYTTPGPEFIQQRRLEVQGRLKSDGRYVLAGDLDVQAGGRVDLLAGGYVAPAAHLDVAGRLAVSAPLGVAGIVRAAPGSLVTMGGLDIEPLAAVKLRGGATIGGALTVAGLLEAGEGGNVSAFNPVLLNGSGARLAVAPGGQMTVPSVVASGGATLDVGGDLRLFLGADINGGMVQVQAGGRLQLGGTGTLFASVVNAGTMQLAAADLAMPGGAFNNSGQLVLTSRSSFTPGAAATFNNLASGRIEVADGSLVLSGSGLTNQGTVQVGRGQLTLVSGTLLNSGHVQTGSDAEVVVNAGATVFNSGNLVLGGDFANAGVVNNSGQLTLRPDTGSSFENLSQIVNSGSLVVDAASIGGSFSNGNLLRNEGSLRVAVGSVLHNSGLLANNGTLRVEGLLELAGSGAFAQSPAGRLVVIGRLATQGGLSLDGGSLSGTGVIDGALLLSGSSTVMPGNSPGMLTLTGRVELGVGSRLELEIDARGAHDTLHAGEFWNTGGTVALSFVDGVVPDIDQSFEWVRVDNGSAFLGSPVGLPHGLSYSEYVDGALSGERRRLAFQPSDTVFIGASHFDAWTNPAVLVDQTLVADGYDGDLLPHQGLLTVEGRLGLRRDAVWHTEGSILVAAGGRFSTSSRSFMLPGSLEVAGDFTNRGQARLLNVQVAAGGRFVNEGALVLGDTGTGVLVENRGFVRHGGGNGAPASWTLAPDAQLRFDNHAAARWEVAAPLDVQGARVFNEGAFVIGADGILSVLSLEQDAGGLHVDGTLRAGGVGVTGGQVSGRGRIDATLVTGNPGCCSAFSPPVVLRPGSEDGRQAGTLTLGAAPQLGYGSQLEFIVDAEGDVGKLQLEFGGSFMAGVLLQVVLLEGALPLEPLSVALMTWTGDTPEGLWTVANFGSRVVVRGALGDSDWDGGSWALNLQQGELQLMLTPVPEPTTYGLMLAGLGLVAWLKRRRPGREEAAATP